MMQTIIRKRATKLFLIAICTITILPLWALISIYADLYPNSTNIRLNRPGTLNYSSNNNNGQKSCKAFFWGAKAQTDTSQEMLLEYYSKRWNQAGYWGGTDTYNVFTIVGIKHGVFVVKYIQTPPLDNQSSNKDGVPLTYVEGSRLELCKMQNFILEWTDS